VELAGSAVSDILESISDAFLAVDTAGRFRYVNRQAEHLIGRPRAELLGELVWAVFPALQGSRMQREYDRAVRLNVAVEFEDYYADRQAWLEMRAYPHSEGMAIYFRDVTKRKHAEEAQRAMVAMVSHDLRNPLFLIKGTIELLRTQLGRGAAPVERIVADLARVERSADQMDRVVDDLMDLVQLQSGHRVVLDRLPCDLITLAQRVADVYQFTTTHHEIRVHTELDRLVGEWDERRLERVLANLLSNAIKYSGSGQIVVTVGYSEHDSRSCATIAVTDHGMGIAPEDLPHIFQRFYRGRAIASAIPGVGVGLAGSLYLVEEHGGGMEVDSCEGKGTTFTVWLPLSTGAPRRLEAVASPASTAKRPPA
jgi:PAS domain S-box-containing protein